MPDRADGAVFLVKAIEEADRSGTLLPFADREHASRDALRTLGLNGEELRRDDRFRALRHAMRLRAEALTRQLTARYPVVDEVLDRTDWPPWLTAALLFGALACGLLLSALDGANRIDILAIPFLGVIGWNVLVYLVLVTAWLRRRAPTEPRSPTMSRTLLRSISRPMRSLARRTASVDTALGTAVSAFVTDWASRASPPLAQRFRRLLHLGSASLALGLLAGLYLRGVVFRYEAGWDSTFLTAEHVRRIVGIVYAWPSAITGVALPRTSEAVAALRWSGGTEGVDAAPWIHLIAAALLLYVILPRALLAVAAAIAEWRIRAAPWSNEMLSYARRVLGATVRGTTEYAVQIVPYAYQISAAQLQSLARQLESRLGTAVAIEPGAAVAYGGEALVASSLAAGTAAFDARVLLFALAATPEAENHGAVIKTVRDASNRPGAPLLLVAVDESAYAERFGQDPALRHRLDERRALWRDFVSAYGLEAWIVDLRRLETVGHVPASA
jgi:hypothetical protein